MPVTGTIEQAPRDQYVYTDALTGDILFRSLCNINWLFGSGIASPSTISINSNLIVMRPNNLSLDTNVGIRNSAPGYELDVTGDINFTGNIMQNGSIYYPSPFVSNLSYPTKVYYSGGNVGIGTNNPSYPLHVTGTTYTTTLIASNVTTNPATASNTLSIGVDSNTTTINMGNPNTTLNIYGVLSFVDTCNLQVNDTLITLNKGNAAATGLNAGFEIEENGVATGYIKTSTDRNSFLFRAPTGTADMIMNLANNKVNINSNIFLMDTANRRIGINTATPSYDLDVTGTINATSILVGGTALQIGYWKSSNNFNYTQSNAVIGSNNNPQSSRLFLNNTGTTNQGGTGDLTNITSNALTIYDVAYPRVVLKSGDASIATVYNYESNKHILWGESTDSSNVSYNFRGRAVAIGYATSKTSAYKLDVNGDANVGGVLEVGNRIRAVNNLSVATTSSTEVLNMTGNIGMVHNGSYYPSTGASDKWITIGQNTLTATPLSQSSNYGYTSTWNQYSMFFGLRDYSTYKDALISFGGATTNRLRFQYSNVDIMTLTGSGSIGIGKTNPGYTLDVNGTVNATSVLISGQPLSLGTAGGFSATTGGITYTTCNVGIGTADPGTNALRVSGNLQVDSNLLLGNGQMTFQGVMITRKATGGAANVTSVLYPTGYAYSNDIYITANASTNSIISQVGTQEVMRATAVTTNGYVGIMNSTPSNTLEVGAPTTGTTAGGATGGTRVAAVPLVANHTSLPTSSTQLNDPQPVFVMTRAGTANVSSPAQAIFNLSRYEDLSVTSAKTRMDIQLVHTSNSGTVPTIMTMRSDGNVGVGTTNPQYKLDVNGIVNATALYVGGSAYMGSQWTTSTSNVYITGSNVGIGTNLPQSLLQVNGNIMEGTTLLSAKYAASNAQSNWNNGSNVAYWTSNNRLPLTGGTLNGQLRLGDTTLASGLRLLVADYDGTADGTRYGQFQITMNANNGNSNSTQCNMATSSFVRSGNVVLGMGFQTLSNAFGFGPGVSSNTNFVPWWLCMKTANGFVGLSNMNPQYRLDVSGHVNVTGYIFCSTQISMSNNTVYNTPQIGGNGGTGDRIILAQGTGSAHPYSLGVADGTLWRSVPTGAQHYWYIGGSAVMSLSNTGTNAVLATTGDIAAFGSVSDQRLKENISSLSLQECLQTIDQLRPVEYDWNSNAFNGEHIGQHDIGFIAQEVEQAIPQAAKDVNFFGETYKTIKYERIIPYLAGAIKELSETNKELKERISILESKVCQCC